jgi:hypothetical protein
MRVLVSGRRCPHGPRRESVEPRRRSTAAGRMGAHQAARDGKRQPDQGDGIVRLRPEDEGFLDEVIVALGGTPEPPGSVRSRLLKSERP